MNKSLKIYLFLVFNIINAGKHNPHRKKMELFSDSEEYEIKKNINEKNESSLEEGEIVSSLEEGEILSSEENLEKKRIEKIEIEEGEIISSSEEELNLFLEIIKEKEEIQKQKIKTKNIEKPSKISKDNIDLLGNNKKEVIKENFSSSKLNYLQILEKKTL